MNVLQRLLIRGIDRYQVRGGGLATFRVACNFEPTCSHYARQAIAKYGAVRGLVWTWRRVRRCRQRDLVVPIRDPLPTDPR